MRNKMMIGVMFLIALTLFAIPQVEAGWTPIDNITMQSYYWIFNLAGISGDVNISDGNLVVNGTVGNFTDRFTWAELNRTIADTNASTACSGVQYLAGNGSCIVPSGVGDITGVEAGTGLVGGGGSGDVILNVSADICGVGNVSKYNGTHFECVVDATGGGGSGDGKAGDGTYLYNDSTTMFFNTTLADTNLSVNKSDFWDLLDTVTDILGSLITNDLNWINQTQANATGDLRWIEQSNEANLNVNSSDFWDLLDTIADILGSGINNDLNWINQTQANTTGDLRYVNVGEDINATFIKIALGGGSPTVDQVQEYLDNTGSSGFFLGGELSDGGAGTLDVSAGSGFIRTTNDENAELQSFKWSASAGIAVTDNTTQYVYVEDDGVISLSTDEFLETPDKIKVGVVTDEDGSIESVFSLGVRLEEGIGEAGRFLRNVFGITRNTRKGGLIFGQSGDANRDVTMTAGQLEWGRTSYPINVFDTSGVDTFSTYSASGAENTTATQWDNDNYDNAGTLTSLSNNRWANLFFFLEPDNHIVMIYGREQFTSQSLAEDEGVPSSSLPSRVSETSILAAKFTFQKSSNTATISSAFDTLFANAAVTDHGDLAGLSDDDHTQYALDTKVDSLGNYSDENSTIARTGDCPAGQFVQNTTTGGVECEAPAGGGTVTSVSAGDGMTFSTITGSGPVTLGTPGTLNAGTSNGVSADAHLHAVTSATPSNGDMTSFSTADQIWDWAVAKFIDLTSEANLNVNSSDFWDLLDTPADILGSLINNDLNWVNQSQVNTTGDLRWILQSEEGNLNVNSSGFWDDLDTPADINAADITDDGTYLKDILEDTTPQLGGFLDTNGNDIGSTISEIENIYVGTDTRIYFGDGQEGSLYYNGTNLILQG